MFVLIFGSTAQAVDCCAQLHRFMKYCNVFKMFTGFFKEVVIIKTFNENSPMFNVVMKLLLYVAEEAPSMCFRSFDFSGASRGVYCTV